MPTIVEHTLYTFDELSDRAKEIARDWWRQCENDDFDAEYVIEDAERMGAILGIEFDTRRVQLMSGATRTEPRVYWSGFSSQGDGAQFEGRYAYAKGAPAKIKKETGGTDSELYRIALDLQATQKRNRYRLEARTDCKRAQYSHSGWMNVEVWADTDRDIGDAESEITRALRDFADWIYRQLESEYEWRMADEQVDDAILANEYTFDENGHRAN
ncbi:MAG: antitoxin of toxin-antitoxin stability system [Hyphomicrobium sp.]|jgi:hypothetical protein